eukprot:jgi/Undpi1/2299/HiC_scaffold_13.g05683.m1
MRSVRGDEMPEEFSNIGSVALDVAAYRAWPALHPFVIGAWAELGVETGCYHDIAFRTGNCVDECDPSHAIHKYLRDKYIPFEDTLDSSEGLPYNFGPTNSWTINSTYLSPYDWLYGDYAPPFWQENAQDLMLSEDATVRWAARDRIVAASREFEINGTPSTMLTLEMLAMNGYNSNGVYMTKEDYDFFLDGDCSAGEHVTTRISLHDMIVEHANNFANGLGLGLGGYFLVPVDEDGKQKGFDLLAILILEKLEAMGVKLYFHHQVYGTRPNPKRGNHAVVRVQDLETLEQYKMDTEHAVLNVPHEFILEVLGDGAIEKYGRDDLYDVFLAMEQWNFVKAYPYYADAWWAKLGYVSGRMMSTQHIYHTRYHDGYSNCTDDTFTDCSGTLLATYTQGDRGEQWMQQFFPKKSFADSYDGLTTIRRGEGPTEQDDFLDAVHAQNMESHRDALAEVGIDTDDIAAPDVCLVGVFIGSVAGAHVRPTYSMPPGTIDEAVNEPFPGYNIHLVNEAYGIPGGWLQSSLYSSERMLHHYYGLDKPSWLTDDIYEGFDADSYYNSAIGNSNGDGK